MDNEKKFLGLMAATIEAIGSLTKVGDVFKTLPIAEREGGKVILQILKDAAPSQHKKEIVESLTAAIQRAWDKIDSGEVNVPMIISNPGNSNTFH